MKLKCIVLYFVTTFAFAAQPLKAPTGTAFDRIAKNSAEGESKLKILKCPSIAYQKEIHGPKVKDFFIGMDYKQFKLTAEKLIKSLSQDKIGYEYGMCGADDKEIRLAISRNGNHDSEIAGAIDQQGLITYISIDPGLVNAAFKVSDLRADDFVKKFEQAYGVSLKFDLGSKGYNTYETITAEGVKITIGSFKDITMRKTTKPTDTKKAFD